jgi:hypothetical protein
MARRESFNTPCVGKFVARDSLVGASEVLNFDGDSVFGLAASKSLRVSHNFCVVSLFYARFLYIFGQNFFNSASKSIPPSHINGTCHNFMRAFNYFLVRVLSNSRQKHLGRVIFFVRVNILREHSILCSSEVCLLVVKTSSAES